MTEQALLISILAIGIVLLVLTLAIIVMKGVRGVQLARLQARRKALEPALQRYLAASEGRIADHVSVPARGVGRAATVEFLLQHADLLKGDARERITSALEEIGMVDEEIARLGSRSWWWRAAAAERLALAHSQRATRALAERLEDPDPEVRLRCARALGDIRGSTAVAPLVAALAQPTRWSTLRVADILSTMGQEAEEGLIQGYPRLPRSACVAAIDILGRLRRPGSAAFLEQRLHDEDPDVRARAAHALGQIADPTTHRCLAEAMRDPEWPVRAMAAKALGRLRANEATEALKLGLRDREWWVRSNAALALRDLGDAGMKALLSVLDSPDTYARHQAVLMLQECGVIDKCVESLSRNGNEMSLAHQVVSKIVALGQTDRLRELSLTHADETVRRTLSALLSKTPGPGAP